MDVAITWKQRRTWKMPLVQLEKYLPMFARTLHKHLPVSEHFVPSFPQDPEQAGPRGTALSVGNNVPEASGGKGNPSPETVLTAAQKIHSGPSCGGSGSLTQDTGASQRAQ